jgi:hypothetical protein
MMVSESDRDFYRTEILKSKTLINELENKGRGNWTDTDRRRFSKARRRIANARKILDSNDGKKVNGKKSRRTAAFLKHEKTIEDLESKGRGNWSSADYRKYGLAKKKLESGDRRKFKKKSVVGETKEGLRGVVSGLEAAKRFRGKPRKKLGRNRGSLLPDRMF